MSKRIWITKDWENSCTITVWTEKPIWYPNGKYKQPHDHGFWGLKDYENRKDRFSHDSCVFHDCMDNLFKVKFHKKKYEGFIAERILSLKLPKG